MNLGFAVTRHCNLRCNHCIRDDVTEVECLDPQLLASVLDQALEYYPTVKVALTGGEPLIHPDFDRIVRILSTRQLPWRFVSNGWHMARSISSLEFYPPEAVHLSLSGADRRTHESERGRGSWNRVLLSVGLLRSREIPAQLSLVVDRRTRDQLSDAAELGESLGCAGIQYILPQPVPGSAARGSDLPPDDWMSVRREVDSLSKDPKHKIEMGLAYGAPFEEEEKACPTFRMNRLYVDPEGRLCTCCQLSEYGSNDREVVADLNQISLSEAFRLYRERLQDQWRATRPDEDAQDPFLAFPCMRCAKANGKLEWLQHFPESSWAGARNMAGVEDLSPTRTEGTGPPFEDSAVVRDKSEARTVEVVR